jgi:hypothetical protein
MTDFSGALGAALALIGGADATLWGIIALSLSVSLSAVAVASLVGLPLGAAVAVYRFPGRALLWGCRRWWSVSSSISSSRVPARSGRSASSSPRRRW